MLTADLRNRCRRRGENVLDSRVTIVGAGPSGLTLAWWLVEAGVPVTVLEQADTLPVDMRASTFHPATLDLLAGPGFAAALVQRGTPVARWQYLVHASGDRVVFDMGCLAGETAFPFRLQCEQFQLTRLLTAELQAHPLCRVLFGARCEKVVPGTDGVELSYTRAGRSVTEQCDWLLAADGAHSIVRKQLGLGFSGEVFAKTSITLVLDHDFTADIPNLLGVNYVWLPDRHYSLMRLRDTWRFTYSPEVGQDEQTALADEIAREHIARVAPSASDAAVLSRNFYTLHQRCMDNFCHGRVVFLGDAAHLNSPAGGMGMNSGIHDAHCLAEHLIPVLEGADPALLERYDRRRQTIARDEVQRLSARNYARHRETRAAQREAIWRELQDTVADPKRHKDYLLDAAMIRSRYREQAIA